MNQDILAGLQQERTGRGRKRSADVHAAILEATRALLSEHGYEGLSMEAIAARAHVGKQTVYRWWPSKASVVAEAVLQSGLGEERHPVANTGDVTADLSAWFSKMSAAMAEPGLGAIVSALAAASIDRVVDADRLNSRFTATSRSWLVQRMRIGMTDGQLRADADVELAADAIIGMLIYRSLSGQHQSANTESNLIDLLVNGMAIAHS